MKSKDRILGGIYGAMIGEAMGNAIDRHGYEILQTHDWSVLENTCWMKHQLYVATNVLKVFSEDSIRIQKVPEKTYLSYVVWMANRMSAFEGPVPHVIQEVWCVEDFRYLNSILEDQVYVDAACVTHQRFAPVFLEFETLFDQVRFGRTLSELTTGHGNCMIHDFHNEVMFYIGKTPDFKSAISQVRKSNGVFRTLDLEHRDPGMNQYTLCPDYREYFNILQVMEGGLTFEKDLFSVLKTTTHPKEYGMLAGNLLGKYYGLKGIPMQYVMALKAST